jgi:hypothetical protein
MPNESASTLLVDAAGAVGAPSGAAGRLWRALVALAAVPLPMKRKGNQSGAAAGRSENLVVAFDEAYTSFVDSFETLPGEIQLLALQAMDKQLSSMVRAKDADLWTQKAHLSDPHWIKVRFLAADVIEAFDWPQGSETGVAGRLTLHEGAAE